MVDPAVLCRKHLLGEHVECHMFVGAILKGISLAGYKAKGLIEIHNLKLRHEALSREMLKRGYKHRSPLPIFKESHYGKININDNLTVLKERCDGCKKRQQALR